MKPFGMVSVMAVVVSGWITSYGQEIEPEVPGDHFSLEGALELFKKSGSPQEFEKLLNSPDSKVNNLDLNGDGYIDYIRVFDRYEGNVHAFILQAVVSETENQDVAVIELEKLANGKAVLQIVGDEDIYGIETIIEPTREVRTYAGAVSTPTVVNVWAWPSVQYVYGPYYSGWRSPWGWHHRPVWWRTWRPIVYIHYYNYWRPYRRHYAVCHTHRVMYAHRIYRPYRTTSVVVHNRYHPKVTRYRSAHRDDHYNGRTRNDDGRSGRSSTRDADRERREHADRSRSSSAQREVITLPTRSVSRERSVRPELRREATELKRGNDSPERRSGSVINKREVRPQVTSPNVKRSRSLESPKMQQRPVTRERSVPSSVQRNSGALKREVSPDRSIGTGHNKRETRQTVTRPSQNRRPENSKMQQRSTTVNRNRPSGTPKVLQRPASRSGSRSRGN